MSCVMGREEDVRDDGEEDVRIVREGVGCQGGSGMTGREEDVMGAAHLGMSRWAGRKMSGMMGSLG